MIFEAYVTAKKERGCLNRHRKIELYEDVRKCDFISNVDWKELNKLFIKSIKYSKV